MLEYEKNNIPEKSVRTAVISKRVIAKYRLQQDVEFDGASSIQGAFWFREQPLPTPREERKEEGSKRGRLRGAKCQVG